jgi:ABC-2 type transport system permease protein
MRGESWTNKLLLVIERDVRLFFQYKFLIIMRAIWFVSQVALFGLIASRMISVSLHPIANGNVYLEPNQAYTFQVNTSERLSLLSIDVKSSNGLGDVYIYSPNATLMASDHFNQTANLTSFSFNDTEPGSWSVKLAAGNIAGEYSLDAFIPSDYFRFYVAGLSVMTLYSAAIFIGFDIYEEAEHGVFEYMLSLPVSRRQLVLGRSIGGGLRSFIYVGPLIAISLYVIGAINPLNFLISLTALFLFSFGVSGMSITIAVIIKSSDRFDIFMGVMDALIVRLSTAMYPLAYVQKANQFYGSIANFNPVTFAADLFRWGTGIESIISTQNPLLPFLGIVAFFGLFTLFGVTIYERMIEGGGWQ